MPSNIALHGCDSGDNVYWYHLFSSRLSHCSEEGNVVSLLGRQILGMDILLLYPSCHTVNLTSSQY